MYFAQIGVSERIVGGRRENAREVVEWSPGEPRGKGEMILIYAFPSNFLRFPFLLLPWKNKIYKEMEQNQRVSFSPLSLEQDKFSFWKREREHVNWKK